MLDDVSAKTRWPLHRALAGLFASSVTALAACAQPAEVESERPRAGTLVDAADESPLTTLHGRVVNADGTPAHGTFVGLTRETAVVVDADGGFALSLSSWQVRAPVSYIEFWRQLDDGAQQRAMIPLPSPALLAGFELSWPGSEDAYPVVTLVEDDPAAQAWLDVHRWEQAAWHEWLSISDDPEAVAALWRRLAADIDASSDAHRRMLMQAAQFSVGRQDLELGLDRSEAAEQALAKLGLDNPRWAIWPMALPLAIHEAGRWEELAPELDEAITTHPQPDVAAYVAFERYLSATSEGRWSEAEVIWATIEARPELMETWWGPVLDSYGPNRRLAPGNFFPEVCVEELGGGQLCTAELAGLTVVELWSVGCKGCHESFAKLQELIPRLHAEGIEVELITINPWQDAQEVADYLATNPLPGRHTWVRAEAREQLREQLGMQSVPIVLILGPDGRILDSTPTLQTDTLEALLYKWHRS